MLAYIYIVATIGLLCIVGVFIAIWLDSCKSALSAVTTSFLVLQLRLCGSVRSSSSSSRALGPRRSNRFQEDKGMQLTHCVQSTAYCAAIV